MLGSLIVPVIYRYQKDEKNSKEIREKRRTTISTDIEKTKEDQEYAIQLVVMCISHNLSLKMC